MRIRLSSPALLRACAAHPHASTTGVRGSHRCRPAMAGQGGGRGWPRSVRIVETRYALGHIRLPRSTSRVHRPGLLRRDHHPAAFTSPCEWIVVSTARYDVHRSPRSKSAAQCQSAAPRPMRVRERRKRRVPHRHRPMTIHTRRTVIRSSMNRRDRCIMRIYVGVT
jgi:hypothetical protein